VLVLASSFSLFSTSSRLTSRRHGQHTHIQRSTRKAQGRAANTRRSWNGKGQFIYLVDGSSFAVNRPRLLGIFPEGTEINYRPHIDIRTVDGSCVPWIASQSDLLADDWEVTEAA
jgi:hypothetical protein